MNAKQHIPKQRGFKVPDGYFDKNHEVLSDRLDFDSILGEDTAYPFDVPDGYFENNTTVVLDTLSRKRNKENHSTLTVVRPYKHLYPLAGIAASLLFVLGILWTQMDSESITAEDIETTAITSYLYDSSSSLESIDFADWLTIEDLDAMQTDIALDETVIINYLEDRTDSYDF